MRLNQVREVVYNEVNEVYICEDRNSGKAAYYTLWKIKDHLLSKALLEELSRKHRIDSGKNFFAGKDFMGFLFPYEKERPLFRFYAGKMRSLKERERIRMELVKACMMEDISSALLYLLLAQRQIQLQEDHTVRFSYGLDLRQFDRTKTEQDCVNLCAELLVELMEEESGKINLSQSLLTKRLHKGGYYEFSQLYRDLKLSSARSGKRNILKKAAEFAAARKDTIFRALLAACFLMVLLAFVMIVSQAIFGEIPFFRIFQKCFETIGTESLLQ